MIQEEITTVVAHLTAVLGTRLIAVATNASQTTVVKDWQNGRKRPTIRQARILRDLGETTAQLLIQDSAQTVRAWWSGMNPELEDQSPIRAIAKQPDQVKAAARAFCYSG